MNALFIHDIDPVLVTIGPLAIRYYGLFFALAAILGLFILKYLFKQKGYNPNFVDEYILYLLIGIIVGARLIHVMFYHPEFYCNNPVEIFKVWKGGIASHGATLGSIVATYIFAKRKMLTFYQVADLAVIPIALGTAFIRLGNFINSEIVGKVTDLPWGVIFQRYHGFKVNGKIYPPEAEHILPRHPSQIYEMFMGLIVFGLLFYLFKKYREKLANGIIFYSFLISYFVLRFIVEFFKEFQTLIPNKSLFTMGQWLSIAFILAGIIGVYKVRNNRTPQKKKK